MIARKPCMHTPPRTDGPCSLMFLPIVLPTFFAPLIGGFFLLARSAGRRFAAKNSAADAQCAGKMSDRYGPRFLIAGGCVLLVPFLILLRLPDRDSVSAVVLFCVLLTFVGVGMALVVAPVMAEISLVVSDLEEQKPGRFGPNGALAQAVGFRSSSPLFFILRKAARICKQPGGSDKKSVRFVQHCFCWRFAGRSSARFVTASRSCENGCSSYII